VGEYRDKSAELICALKPTTDQDFLNSRDTGHGIPLYFLMSWFLSISNQRDQDLFPASYEVRGQRRGRSERSSTAVSAAAPDGHHMAGLNLEI
jgi:hypothetical protein